MFLLQSGIIPLSFLPTSGLFCKDATHILYNILYITGDFIVTVLPHIKSSLDPQDFKYIFSSSFFTLLITKPTRVTDHSAILIDNIYCNIPEVSTHCKVGILKLSIGSLCHFFTSQTHQYVIK